MDQSSKPEAEPKKAPALISLSFRGEDGEFEPVVIAPLSTPPELPDVMKPQESVSNSDGS